jgi:hypothetical protein
MDVAFGGVGLKIRGCVADRKRHGEGPEWS